MQGIVFSAYGLSDSFFLIDIVLVCHEKGRNERCRQKIWRDMQ